jgi:hypothetical protein
VTTSRFSALASATARAIASVRTEHCPAPDFRPAAPVRGSMRCTKCAGLLHFTAATSGRTTGRCSSAGCVTWNEI